MAESENPTIARIRQYAEDTRATQHEAMDVDSRELEARLSSTVEQLQQRVKEQQAILEELRASTTPIATRPSSDRQTRFQQLKKIKTAYDDLAADTPELPPPDSLIPALLATRTVREAISTTSADITNTQDLLSKTNAHLTEEQATHTDSLALRTALQSRLTTLRQQRKEHTQKSSSQIGRDLLAAEKAQVTAYKRSTKALERQLNEFIAEHLSTLLAAEELGGPIVGDDMDIDEEDLQKGFNAKGKKKGKGMQGQKRLDDIWNRDGDGEDGDNARDDPAAAELRELLDALLKAQRGESEGGVYVTLPRDSAAARFLVRCKVAQYHPKDARRLRVIDFGRGLDD